MAKKTVNLENKTVTFDFDDGGDPVLFDLTKCSKAMILQLALHGSSQKGGDSYASAKKVCADTDIDPVDWSRAQVMGVIDQLYNDDWTVRVPGAGITTDLATALAEAAPCDLADAIARLADASKDDRAALRKNPDIAAVLARIKSERAAAKATAAATKIGTGEDLSAFMGG